MRPDHLEELLTAMALQPGMTPERLMKAKERIEKKQEQLRVGPKKRQKRPHR